MKKLLTVGVILLAAVFVFSGCAKKETAQGGTDGKKADGGKLYIYNWTYYIPDEVLKDFENEFNVQYVYDVFASNEEMFAKLKAGGTGYDIVVPSGDYVSIMIHEGMLEQIDKSKVPNFGNIDPTALAKIKFDPGNGYSVPYFMAAAGVAVNKTKVQNYEKSWNVFDRKDLKNRMTMLDDMREVFGAALKSLGFSVNTVDPAELEKAKNVVLGWKENILKFDAEAFAKGFANGEFFVVQGYAENVFNEYDAEKKDEVDYFIPKEGGPMYIDSLCILKDAKNKEQAYAFINYIHRPDVYAKIADYLKLPALNTKARELTKLKPNYSYDDLANCELKEDLGANLELYNKLWQEIRVGN